MFRKRNSKGLLAVCSGLGSVKLWKEQRLLRFPYIRNKQNQILQFFVWLFSTKSCGNALPSQCNLPISDSDISWQSFLLGWWQTTWPLAEDLGTFSTWTCPQELCPQHPGNVPDFRFYFHPIQAFSAVTNTTVSQFWIQFRTQSRPAVLLMKKLILKDIHLWSTAVHNIKDFCAPDNWIPFTGSGWNCSICSSSRLEEIVHHDVLLGGLMKCQFSKVLVGGWPKKETRKNSGLFAKADWSTSLTWVRFRQWLNRGHRRSCQRTVCGFIYSAHKSNADHKRDEMTDVIGNIYSCDTTNEGNSFLRCESCTNSLPSQWKRSTQKYPHLKWRKD